MPTMTTQYALIHYPTPGADWTETRVDSRVGLPHYSGIDDNGALYHSWRSSRDTIREIALEIKSAYATSGQSLVPFKVFRIESRELEPWTRILEPNIEFER